MNIKRPGRPFYERLIIAAGLKTGLGRKGNTYDLLEQQDRLLKKYPYEGARYIIDFSGQYRFKSMFLYSDYGKGRPYLFEGLKVNGPVNYDRILTSIVPEENDVALSERVKRINAFGKECYIGINLL